MAGAYAAEWASAHADVAAAGAPVSFQLPAAGGAYDPLTDLTTGAVSTIVSGHAVRVKGNPLKYQMLDLVPSESPTLLFAPDVYGEVPALNSTVSFGGLLYAVRDVDPLAPDGVAITARVVVTGGGPVPLIARVALILAPITLSARGGPRFTSAGVLATPPVALAGAGDNGVLLAYSAGDALPAGSAFIRASTATYFDANGIIRTANANTLRDGHYIGGVRTTLLEGSRTNSALWSRDLTNGVWGGTAGVAQNATGLDGTANSATTLTDSDAASAMSRAQSVAIPVDANTHTASFWVLKDTNQARFPGFDAHIVGGTTVQRIVSLNTQTGAMASITAVGTTTARVVDAGLWWVVEIAVTNNSTAGNTAFTAVAYPALGSALGGNSVTPTGSIVVGHVQLELNSAFYSSPIFTTAAAVTRAPDNLSVPFAAPPQAMTVLIAGVDVGSGRSGAGAGGKLAWFGDAATAGPFLAIEPTGTPGCFDVRQSDTIGAVSSTSTNADALGDSLEARAAVAATGSVTYSQSLNGGAETTAAASAARALPSAWGAPTLWLGGIAGQYTGYFGFRSVKIARGVKTLAQMRAFTS